MRVSLKWLNELIPVDLPVDRLCDRLDMTGTKVEAVHTLGVSLEGVVIGQVLTRVQHPDADRLSVCTVDVGDDTLLQIVCGATNFAEGDRVPVARVGATLPGGLTIKRAKLRGVESQGMMCSEAELGTAGDASGLLILSPDAPVGEAYSAYAGLSDTVLELEITPNRPDCLSMTGVAREISAITGAPFIIPSSTPVESGDPAASLVSIEIADPTLCPRYTARVVRGLKVGPSPVWLAERVIAAGARSVNNVVDVTNFILYELGQPLHAFDMGRLAKRDGKTAIIVRAAAEGEVIHTLDGRERTLASDAVLITDASGPVALAGVMGGEDTEVSDETVDVLIESACFDPASISRTSRRLGLVSESSLRYERGVDPELAVLASDRAAALLAEVAGGTVAPGIVDVYPGRKDPLRLTLRPSRVNAVLGTGISAERMAGIISSIGMSFTSHAEAFDVVVPSFRPDIEREIDLIEEIARLYGLENIGSTLPGGRERVGGRTLRQRLVSNVGSLMRSAGLDEHIGYSFGDRADLGRLGWTLSDDELLVDLINPMSEEQAVMRWTLAPSLLRAVSRNQRHGVPDVHLYELGTTFVAADGAKQPRESQRLGGVLTGSWVRQGWSEPSVTLGFFDGKGVLESLFDALHVSDWSVRSETFAWLQPGRSAEVLCGREVIGCLGEVDEAVLDAYDATGPVVIFELDVDGIERAAASAAIAYRDIPRFPGVTLDLALVVDEGIEAEKLRVQIESADGALLESVRLFDVFRDPPGIDPDARRLPVGRKSLAFSLVYRAADRTLTDADVRPVQKKLVRRVCAATGAELRS